CGSNSRLPAHDFSVGEAVFVKNDKQIFGAHILELLPGKDKMVRRFRVRNIKTKRESIVNHANIAQADCLGGRDDADEEVFTASMTGRQASAGSCEDETVRDETVSLNFRLDAYLKIVVCYPASVAVGERRVTPGDNTKPHSSILKTSRLEILLAR
ncbi:hypothetical protein FOL47_003570, partial [Perkinsus chesapeaki]